MSEPRVSVSNDEMCSVREAMRTLNRLVDDLVLGDREKVVLMKRGRMVAVIVPLREFGVSSDTDTTP